MSKVILFNRQMQGNDHLTTEEQARLQVYLQAVLLKVNETADLIEAVQKSANSLKRLGITFDGFARVDDRFEPAKTPYIILDNKYEAQSHDLKEYVALALCRDEVDIDLYVDGYEAGSGKVNTLDIAQVILSQPLQA